MNQWTKRPVSLRERFYQKFEAVPEAGCWIWTGSKGHGGRYGSINCGGRMRGAHVVSYELHVGPIPNGMEVCHRCDVGFCVNPHHLFLGTHRENCADRDRKGRNIAHRGGFHWGAVLTDMDVMVIRASDKPGVQLAKEFGVTPTTISAIRNRRSWVHI